jgi:hypothetical protein
MNLIISSKNNNDNLNNKIIYDFIVIVIIILISILLLFDYLITIIELKDELKSIKKYVESLTNIENHNYKDTRTKIILIMNNLEEEQYKNIEHQKQIGEIQKKLKDKEEQYQNIENKFNKLLEEFINKDIEHKLHELIEKNKQLAINIYYYWKTAHTVNPGLISYIDIIDGIYKHFYDTTFDTETNNISHEILEKTIPFLIKKKQKELLDNTIFR